MQANYSIPTAPREIFNQHSSLQVQDEIITYVSSTPNQFVPNVGILVYIDGATYPKKGFPTLESTGAINIVKSVIKESLRQKGILLALLFQSSRTKLLTSFNIIADKTLSPYILKEEYMCPTARHVYHLTKNILITLKTPYHTADYAGKVIGHLFEYDDAYRYRLQDIATELSTATFLRSPGRELLRLRNIFKERERDKANIFGKVDRLLTPLILLVLISPKIKKTLRQNIRNLEQLKYDPSDKYWACLKGDRYLFTGLPYEERIIGLQVPQPVKIKL